jgi:branched-chain amino acid transport system ATP-binding protein
MLKLTDVDAYYGLHHILHGVCMTLQPGEMLALLGRNGAGKTTTLRTIMGLVDRRTGTIEYDGSSLLDKRPHEINRMGIAYVPEYRGIFSALTAEDNLRIAALRPGKWRMEDVFELFPALRELRGRRGGHLSGGEQQMLAIGRALLSSPSYLLLDEPSQGLAPVIVDIVIDTLHKLRREKIGILLVEQNADLAIELADRICIIDQGSIAFDGTAAELKQQPTILSSYLSIG